jgi:membrane protease YdiL (CAAX protease family)
VKMRSRLRLVLSLLVLLSIPAVAGPPHRFLRPWKGWIIALHPFIMVFWTALLALLLAENLRRASSSRYPQIVEALAGLLLLQILPLTSGQPPPDYFSLLFALPAGLLFWRLSTAPLRSWSTWVMGAVGIYLILGRDGQDMVEKAVRLPSLFPQDSSPSLLSVVLGVILPAYLLYFQKAVPILVRRDCPSRVALAVMGFLATLGFNLAYTRLVWGEEAMTKTLSHLAEVPFRMWLLAHADPYFLLSFILAMAVIASTEEYFYRHYLLMRLRDSLGWSWALLLSSLAFSVSHISLILIPYAFLVGLLWSFLRYSGVSLSLLMFIHFLSNLWILLPAGR